MARKGDVVIGDIVVCPCVVFSTGILYRRVIVGHIDGTSEHKMLKQVSKSCMFGVFIACTHIIEDIQCHHLSGVILRMDNA